MTRMNKNNFKEFCKTYLPNYIKVEDVEYALYCNIGISGTYRISYIEYVDHNWNYGNKLLDLNYEIVEKIPESIYDSECELKDRIIYVQDVADIIVNCSDILKCLKYLKINQITNKENVFDAGHIYTKPLKGYQPINKLDFNNPLMQTKRIIPNVPVEERSKLNEGVDKKVKRPPLGLKPKFLVQEQRIKEIEAAVIRYFEAYHVIPIEWIEEYNEIVKTL
jgi:hypothetical protein